MWEADAHWWDWISAPFVWLGVRMNGAWRDLRHRFQRFRRGYSDGDVWEMRDWFLRSAKPMLRQLSRKAFDYPEELGEEAWRGLLEHMAALLEIMDLWDDSAARKAAGVGAEDRSREALERIALEQEKAKDEFFTLYSKWFYHL